MVGFPPGLMAVCMLAGCAVAMSDQPGRLIDVGSGHRRSHRRGDIIIARHLTFGKDCQVVKPCRSKTTSVWPYVTFTTQMPCPTALSGLRGSSQNIQAMFLQLLANLQVHPLANVNLMRVCMCFQ
jgi:hypothetical protein